MSSVMDKFRRALFAKTDSTPAPPSAPKEERAWPPPPPKMPPVARQPVAAPAPKPAVRASEQEATMRSVADARTIAEAVERMRRNQVNQVTVAPVEATQRVPRFEDAHKSAPAVDVPREIPADLRSAAQSVVAAKSAPPPRASVPAEATAEPIREREPVTQRSVRPLALRPIEVEDPEEDTLDRDTADDVRRAAGLIPVVPEPEGPWAEERSVRFDGPVSSTRSSSASSSPVRRPRRPMASSSGVRSEPLRISDTSCPASSGALWPDDEEEAAISPVHVSRVARKLAGDAADEPVDEKTA